MASSALSNHGVELTSRGVAQAAQTLLDDSSGEPQAQPQARRRATLADLSRELQSHEDEAQKQKGQHRKAKGKAALAFYTLARIAANVCFLLSPVTPVIKYSDADYVRYKRHVVIDSILRPLITGLGVFAFLYREDRFSAKKPVACLELCRSRLPRLACVRSEWRRGFAHADVRVLLVRAKWCKDIVGSLLQSPAGVHDHDEASRTRLALNSSVQRHVHQAGYCVARCNISVVCTVARRLCLPEIN